MTDSSRNRIDEFEDIASYLKLIKSIQDKNKKYKFVYRGHASLLYEIIPSIFREPEYIRNESKLMRDLISNNADDFQGDDSTFDRLVRMQHHGLPTRLLDVTTNALVALYFACSEHRLTKANSEIISTRKLYNSDERYADGRILLLGYFSEEMKYFDSLSVSCHANIALLDNDQKEKLGASSKKFFLGNSEINRSLPDAEENNDAENYNKDVYVKKLKRLVSQDNPGSDPDMSYFDLTKIHLVRPKMTNKRINAQSGLFYIFGINDSRRYLSFKNTVTEVALPHRFKKTVLKELDTVGINQRTIYPGIESTASYLTDLLK